MKKQEMRRVPTDIVEAMIERRRGAAHEPVMIQFGISDNSWRRIRAGEAIRASVADRLMSRFSAARQDN